VYVLAWAGRVNWKEIVYTIRWLYALADGDGNVDAGNTESEGWEKLT
jgi:hypothetical protein